MMRGFHIMQAVLLVRGTDVQHSGRPAARMTVIINDSQRILSKPAKIIVIIKQSPTSSAFSKRYTCSA